LSECRDNAGRPRLRRAIVQRRKIAERVALGLNFAHDGGIRDHHRAGIENFIHGNAAPAS